jgi:hypothetical protein
MIAKRQFVRCAIVAGSVLASSGVFAQDSACDKPVIDSADVLVCQPKEYAGSYGNRYWKADINRICGIIETNKGCINLDQMDCGTDSALCLKWGAHGYAGQIVLPQGISVAGYGDWDCSSSRPRKTYEGDGSTVSDFWDGGSWRITAFKFKPSESYQCKKNGSAYRLVRQCGEMKNRQGTWEYVFSQPQGTKMTRSVTIGRRVAESSSTSSSFSRHASYEYSKGFEAGFEFKGVKAGESTGYKLAGGKVSTVTSEISKLIENSVSETETREFEGAGTWYQFVASYEDPVCGEKKESITRINTDEWMLVPNADQAPCCPPGMFKDKNNPLGDCIDPKVSLCKAG